MNLESVSMKLLSKRLVFVSSIILATLAFVGQLHAQDSAPSAIDSGDTAWILVSTALVLFMTIPALALFYGGLVRTKNILSVLMQCLVLTALLSVIWMVCGYSLAFDSTGMVKGTVGFNSFLGGTSKLFLNGITPDTAQGSIPEILFAAFQMTFAVITPALMVGAFAERMKFSAVLVFSSLWLLVVYIPICHMTWAGDGGYFADMGVVDFAGGIVVHVTAGFAALVACIVVGPREGYPEKMLPPHNMTMTVTGTAMLCLMVTHLSASIAVLVWMAIEWVVLGKPSVLGAATGAIAGLAAITPASGFVGPVGALAIGATSAVVCYLFATMLKQKFGYDDSLDVFGVHGVGGFIGTIMLAVFGTSTFGGFAKFEMGSQLGVQTFAAIVTAVYAMIASYIILKIIQVTIGLRVDQKSESTGLDLSEHEERGYNL